MMIADYLKLEHLGSRNTVVVYLLNLKNVGGKKLNLHPRKLKRNELLLLKDLLLAL